MFAKRHLWLCAGFLFATGAAHAQASCPWLNVATASGTLNGPAALDVSQADPDQMTCAFRYRNQGKVYALQIEVWAHQDVSRGLAAELSACTAPGTALHAIGNEAVLCAEDQRGSHGDAVVGRVRDSIFRVTITTTALNDPAMPRDVLEQKVRDTAEAVAGSLF
jgi:hypothetical protein